MFIFRPSALNPSALERHVPSFELRLADTHFLLLPRDDASLYYLFQDRRLASRPMPVAILQPPSSGTG